jgi:DNA-binding ferritin-like protein
MAGEYNMTRTQELDEIVKNAKYCLKLARQRLNTAQKRQDDVRADHAWMMIGYYRDIIDNAQQDKQMSELA